MVHASTTGRRVLETDLTRNPLIKQWKGVRRVVADSRAELRDSLLALADSLQK